jgi:hypothetical protein
MAARARFWVLTLLWGLYFTATKFAIFVIDNGLLKANLANCCAVPRRGSCALNRARGQRVEEFKDYNAESKF